MFKVGKIVVHKRDICKVIGVEKNFRLDQDYYTLVPLDDSSLTIHTPVLDKRGLIRDVVSREGAEELIQRIPLIEDIKCDNDRMLENTYTALINSGKHEDLIKIIKTTFVRKAERESNGLKVSEKDRGYFKQAEKLFYNEFAIALNMTYDETKEYIEQKVAAIIK